MKATNQQIQNIGSLSSVTLDVNGNVENLILTGTKAMNTNFEIGCSSTPPNAMELWVVNLCTITVTGSPTFTILGTVIPNTVIVSPFISLCKYLNGAWHVWTARFTSIAGHGISIDPATGVISIAAKSLVAGDASDTAAFLFTQMAAFTGHENTLPKIGSDGFITYSDIGTAAAEFIKNLSSDAQDQLTANAGNISSLSGTVAIIGDNQVTDEENIATIAGKQTADEDNISTLQGQMTAANTAIAAINPSKKTYNVPITANTTLTAGSLTDVVYFDSTTGGFTIYLPLISTLADGQIVTLKQYGSDAVTIGGNAGDNGFIDGTGGIAVSLSLSSAGGYTRLQCHAATKTWIVL